MSGVGFVKNEILVAKVFERRFELRVFNINLRDFFKAFESLHYFVAGWNAVENGDFEGLRTGHDFLLINE